MWVGLSSAQEPNCSGAVDSRREFRHPDPAGSSRVLGTHPPLERGQQLRGPGEKLRQGGSVMSPVAAAARPNPQRSARCTHPAPRENRARGRLPGHREPGTPPPPVCPSFFPEAGGAAHSPPPRARRHPPAPGAKPGPGRRRDKRARGSGIRIPAGKSA
ncbi:PREDICTED: U1 small nuclear ribonucleoprotein C [Ficedula albicollis]|uniref:U1 small nuclear ribonucleoprotein C n=1 Tax=Ficedula albicollis TaxID=59894 RepID=UPI0003594BBA|nr:PREDICTED: U1 small nuclear ribonucleoprotein C [Ficedula albicollis]